MIIDADVHIGNYGGSCFINRKKKKEKHLSRCYTCRLVNERWCNACSLGLSAFICSINGNGAIVGLCVFIGPWSGDHCCIGISFNVLGVKEMSQFQLLLLCHRNFFLISIHGVGFFVCNATIFMLSLFKCLTLNRWSIMWCLYGAAITLSACMHASNR